MLQMDSEYLTDIPPYWELMQRYRLPKFQYTARDVKSRMLFLGCADEISIEKSIRMLDHVLSKIAPNFLGEVIVQTDNGVEFSGTTRKCENNQFSSAVSNWGAKHRYIPPGHCNANGDVESIHATIELVKKSKNTLAYRPLRKGLSYCYSIYRRDRLGKTFGCYPTRGLDFTCSFRKIFLKSLKPSGVIKKFAY
jgi:hypothetical protein